MSSPVAKGGMAVLVVGHFAGMVDMVALPPARRRTTGRDQGRLLPLLVELLRSLSLGRAISAGSGCGDLARRLSRDAILKREWHMEAIAASHQGRFR